MSLSPEDVVLYYRFWDDVIAKKTLALQLCA